MNVFAGERIYESYRLGAVGYVNPYGNYIPLASSRIWDRLVEGRLDEAKRIQSVINKIDHTIAEGHPLYGYQCYSKAIPGALGYPVGDERPPLTKFSDLGEEGKQRLKTAERARRVLARMTVPVADFDILTGRGALAERLSERWGFSRRLSAMARNQ